MATRHGFPLSPRPYSIQKLLILIILVVLMGALADAEDGCISCHRKLSPETFIGHSFQDWENSIHSKSGVSCLSCHAGNSQATNVDAAHKGILRSTDPKSPLYFTNIPDLCGQCHSKILSQFKKSVHYSELKRTGKGPNCLTCHGSMATWILRPDQMQQTCSLCHTKPMQAQAALMSLGVAQSTIHKLSQSVPPDKKQRSAYEKIIADLEATVQHWHSFDMPKAIEKSRHLIKQAHDLSTNWKLRPENTNKDKNK